MAEGDSAGAMPARWRTVEIDQYLILVNNSPVCPAQTGKLHQGTFVGRRTSGNLRVLRLPSAETNSRGRRFGQKLRTGCG
jgi:hypothetical protein